MAELLIFGIGDVARLAHHYFTTDSAHDVAAFAVDPQYVTSHQFLGLPLLDVAAAVDRYPPDDYDAFVALGYSRMNEARAQVYERMRALGYTLASYVSSRCSYLAADPPGDNCLIMEDNTIQPFVRIGSDVIMWSGNHIGHDSVIEDHCFISSHVVVSGHCLVGSHCFLGVNSTLHNEITLAPRTLVAAGAVVSRDTTEAQVLLPSRTQPIDKTSDQVNL